MCSGDDGLDLAGQALEDLGSFGVPHIDPSDMPEGFTSVQSVSDLPANIDPGTPHTGVEVVLELKVSGLGQFVVFELGVYIDLEGAVIALFRGVQYHGGCAPRPRNQSVIIPDGAYRIVFVTYPKAAVYLGLATYILGSLRTVKNQVRVLFPFPTLGTHVFIEVNHATLPEGDEEDTNSDEETEFNVTTFVDVDSGPEHDVSRRYLAIGPDIINKYVGDLPPLDNLIISPFV